MEQYPEYRPPKRKRSSFFTAMIGAIIGGLIVGTLSIGYMNSRLDELVGEKTTDPTKQEIIVAEQTKASIPEAVAQKVNPSVVGIQTVKVSLDFFLGPVQQEGVGTGVIVSENGIILTNHHVVTDKPKSITVQLMDGRELQAEKIWSNESMDLAVIKVDAKNLPVAELGNSDQLKVGQPAIAIGNPLGMRFERTVTSGIISALNRSIAVSENNIAEDLIQTDASINPGNSGGPLLNSKGEVVGINTYKVQTGEGMGFAIPINVAKPIVTQIIKNGEFRPTVLGISGLDREIASYINEDYQIEKGIFIVEIDPKGAAYKAGLREGNVITHIDGKEINSMIQLRSMLYQHLPGDTVTITYLDGKREKEAQVKLQEGNY
ncbi:S1C family serine protease [Garciella nitratireducens]|uniref:S1C family serine protease n=1 Tax=Garciella nitratireducens TaxID=218205 RepID=UPI000DEB11D6|nr:trypsin-like peptidase domain-containing protein [Garciella nitratireducens]RBP44010.1 serine protease Do [Garciella nitratireducens]